MKKENYYKYGLFKKGHWSPIILYHTKEEAEKALLSSPKGICEVREILY